MVNSLFGVPIASIIANAVGPGVLPATLVKKAAGTRTTGALSAGTNPTSTSYACRGFIDDYSAFAVSAGMVQMQDKRITLLGATISNGTVAPAPGDDVTIEGATYAVVRVKRDPAGATFELQSRR